MKDVGHAVLALVAFEVTAPGGIKPPTCGQLVTCQLVTYKHGAANRTENSATWEQALQVTRLAG